MVWWPTVWVASDLVVAFPDSRIVSTVGLALFGVGAIGLAQMALSYPTGPARRPARRLLRLRARLPGAGDPERVPHPLLRRARVPVLLASGTDAAPRRRAAVVAPVVEQGLGDSDHGNAPIGLFVLYRRLYRASPGARRTQGPLVVTTTFVTLTSWVFLLLVVLEDVDPLPNLSYVLNSGVLAVALTSFLGLAVTWRARGVVGDLVVELDRAGPGKVRDALARTIGDPTLELALWLPERGAWVGRARGARSCFPTRPDAPSRSSATGWRRSCTTRRSSTSPRCSRRPGRRRVWRSRTSGSRPSCASQLAELRESRSRIVRAGDEERRRLERDLHDGAQQRLLAVGMALQLLRASVDGNERAAALVDETETEVQAPLRELRELARGIHPASSSTTACPPRSRTLAGRAPIPVEVRVPPSGCRPRSRPPRTSSSPRRSRTSRSTRGLARRGADRAGERDGAGRGLRRRCRGRRACGRREGLRGLADRATRSTAACASRARRAAGRACSRSSRAGRDRRRRRAAPSGARTAARGGGHRRRGEAGDAAGLLALVEAELPDVAIVDIRMPPTHTDEGLVAAAEIRDGGPPSECSCSPSTWTPSTRCACSRRGPGVAVTC